MSEQTEVSYQKDFPSYCLQRSFELTNVFIPEVELYLRMYSNDYRNYKTMVTRSMRYYWPGNASMVVVLDSENEEDHKLAKGLVETYPYPRICFQAPVDPKVYRGRGHERMQRDYFYPELFASKEYIGYVDTDTLFVTRVTKDLLFEDGKPVIIGFYGRAFCGFWSKISETTATLFKTKEVMRCMSIFPVIIKVQHIVGARKYLEKLHNTTFDELYEKYVVAIDSFAQYNAFCQFIWMFHRDEYKFYFQLIPHTMDGEWHGEKLSPGRQTPEYYEKHVKPEQKIPKARSSLHYRYFHDWPNPVTYRRTLMSGLCYSGGFEICKEKCNFFNKTALQVEMFIFDFNDWTWDKRCMEAQKRHYASVQKEPNDTLRSAIQLGCDEIDSLTI
ncbi:hypothetical protein CHS0354_023532 [Potamilus streckersoni]|uniref:Uncharacterized protein n=1 Tax=Potamilus streckersoni TaxID=2493646 RepID=A0AAE0RVG7_9BIVA|nr:hypothetical protein CHS0354_023532 [Potamilus streckersoni]